MIDMLTFLILSRLIGFVSFHHDNIAAGFDPELTHWMSYDLSADRYLFFSNIWTAAGFTEKKDTYIFQLSTIG